MKRGERSTWAVPPDEAAVASYLAKLPLPVRLVAADLDALARAAIPDAVVGIKWSVPFYARKGPICYLSAAKEHVTFGLLKGVDVAARCDLGGRLRRGISRVPRATWRSGRRRWDP